MTGNSRRAATSFIAALLIIACPVYAWARTTSRIVEDVVLGVSPDISREQLEEIVFRLRRARQEGTLAEMVPLKHYQECGSVSVWVLPGTQVEAEEMFYLHLKLQHPPLPENVKKILAYYSWHEKPFREIGTLGYGGDDRYIMSGSKFAGDHKVLFERRAWQWTPIRVFLIVLSAIAALTIVAAFHPFSEGLRRAVMFVSFMALLPAPFFAILAVGTMPAVFYVVLGPYGPMLWLPHAILYLTLFWSLARALSRRLFSATAPRRNTVTLIVMVLLMMAASFLPIYGSATDHVHKMNWLGVIAESGFLPSGH